MNTVRSDRFTIEAHNQQMVAFISDLGFGFQFEQVYQDACDLGFTMVSTRTGKEVVWAVNHEARDNDNDVQYWELVPAKPAPASVKGWRVLLYND